MIFFVSRQIPKMVIVLVVTALVAVIETQFQRPLLSVRPQLWQSKPVDWLFELSAERVLVSTTEGLDNLVVKIEGYSPSATRSKERGDLPLSAPLSTDILLSTIAELDHADTEFQIEGSEIDGSVFRFSFEVASFRTNDDLIILDVARSAVGLGSTSVGGRLMSNVNFQIYLSLKTCPPRESRVVCPFADFSGADLSRGDFDRANLRGADLTGAIMVGSKLGGADLSGSVLKDVDLSQAWLVAVDLEDAHLESVSFDRAIWAR